MTGAGPPAPPAAGACSRRREGLGRGGGTGSPGEAAAYRGIRAESQVCGARRAVHAAPRPRLTPQEHQALGWLSEQYAAKLPQLAEAMGRAERSARRSVARLKAAGLVEAESVLTRGGVWVWLTPRGQREVGTGLAPWRLRLGLLAHIAAVNEVRLHIARRAPDAIWVCERQLARDSARTVHLPDALVLTGAERHAIEVELTPKARRRTSAIVSELTASHDAVVYFCAPAARPALDELAGSGAYPQLIVRNLPSVGRS